MSSPAAILGTYLVTRYIDRAVSPPARNARTSALLWASATQVVRLLAGLLVLMATLASLPAAAQPAARDLFVTAGKSLVVDSPIIIQRVSVANPELAEAVAVSPREVLINGKAPGETSLIVWQQGGNRLMFDLNVRPNESAIEAVRRQLAEEFPGQDIQLTVEGKNVFLRGTVKDLYQAERAAAIAGTMGQVVNLLNIEVPPADEQILLKVRFANVDRAAARELGANFVSVGAANSHGSVSTGQFSPPRTDEINREARFTLTDALNVFLFRPDLDLGATLRLLQSKRLLEILAEPNLLAINGKPASFLAGGEFPFPVVQGGANVGAVTIQFREFGVRLNFLPRITPRGTIRLQVTPEVSSLDMANALVFQGFTIPAISTRRVQTEIELENNQSFALAGLLDNRVIESWNKIPGIGDIPIIGKLFQSQSKTRTNTELLVVVTPEIVRPIPAGQPLPQVGISPLLPEHGATKAPRTPGIEATGEPQKKERIVVPIQRMLDFLRPAQQTAASAEGALPPTSGFGTPQAALGGPPAAGGTSSGSAISR